MSPAPSLPEVHAVAPERARALRDHALPILALVLGVLLVYGRTAGFGYVLFDDFDYIVMTPELRKGLGAETLHWAFTSFRGALWMPLTWLSYVAEIQFFGIDTGVMHVTNFVLHAANAVLFYFLAWQVLRQRFAAGMVAALFALHPVHVESVAWIAERKDVLFGFFYIAALNLWLVYARRRGALVYVAMLLAACGAMMSKPMAVSLPVAMLLLCWWPLGRFTPREQALRALVRSTLEIAPVGALAAATALLTIIAARAEMYSPDQAQLVFRLGNAMHALNAYLGSLLLPVRLAGMYPLKGLHYYIDLLPAAATFVSISALAIALRRSRPWIAVAWLWLIIALVPVSGLFQIGSQSRADRFLYIPALGIYLAIGAELVRAGQQWLRRWRAPLAGIVALYGVIASIQVGYWANPYLFSARILDVVGESLDAHVALTEVYLGANDFAKAEQHAQAALRADPRHYQAFTVMGNVYLARHQYAEAERMFRLALERRPQYATARLNLAIALRAQGKDGT